MNSTSSIAPQLPVDLKTLADGRLEQTTFYADGKQPYMVMQFRKDMSGLDTQTFFRENGKKMASYSFDDDGEIVDGFRYNKDGFFAGRLTGKVQTETAPSVH